MADVQSQKRSISTLELLRRFIPYFSKYRWMLVLDLFCALLTTLCDIVLPLVVQQITNRAINDIASLTVNYIFRLGGIYLLLRLVDTAAQFFMTSGGHIMGTYIERDMRSELFHHLMQQSFAFYSDAKVGALMSRLTKDLFEVSEFAHHCPEEFFIGVIKIIVPFIILFGVNPLLTLIIFAVLPVMLVTTRFFNRHFRAVFRAGREQVGEINARVEDSLLGIRVVKSFANEPIEEAKFAEGNEEFVRLSKRKYYWMAGFHTFTRSFDGIMYILVVVLGALFILNGKITVPDYVAYLLYVNTLLTSIRRIVEYMEQFQNGLTGIERFVEMMDIQPDVVDTPEAEDIGAIQGNVAFNNVSFHYSDGDGNTDVLRNISFQVKRGERVALVGPSGGGKTTLCNLIPRFYNTNSGEVSIDGKDVSHVTQRSLRGAIGMVQQDVYLFSGTVLDNILYGKPGASREEVITAAKQAGAHHFIMELPNGYDTYVGERGVKLSGGQKQRISIARVFLKNPPILILDEATSALDNESERVVQQSLEELSQGRTTFTIAHRLTTIRNATKIWVLTENGIEEAGTHHELMQKKGLYYRLYNMYTELPENDPV